MKLRIHTWPENILRKKCEEVSHVDDNIRILLDEMLSLMRIHDGVGLAANQAGLDLRLIVIEAEDRVFKLANPKILKSEGKFRFCEGCLSFPGLAFDIERARKVWISALNEKGQPLELEAEGFLAVVFQHEIDHLNGVVFIDRVSVWQRLKAIGKLQRVKEKTKQNKLRKM